MKNGLIVSNSRVLSGKPVVAGTRIAVEVILEKLAAGESIEQLLDAHPRLTRDAVQTALAFGAEALKSDVVYPYAISVILWLPWMEFSKSLRQFYLLAGFVG